MDQIHVAYKVLLFGAAREIAGNARVELHLPTPCLVGQIRDALNAQFPRLHELRSYAIAVDRTFAHDDVMCTSSSEIAVIPPVSGG